jgi:hypothetical protein
VIGDSRISNALFSGIATASLVANLDRYKAASTRATVQARAGWRAHTRIEGTEDSWKANGS